MAVKKLRLSVDKRAEALFLLDKGYTVDKAAAALREVHHPGMTVEDVRKAYFPRKGVWSISFLQGKPSSEIGAKFFALHRMIDKVREVQSKRWAKLWQDPSLREKGQTVQGKRLAKLSPEEMAKRSGDVFRRLFADPVFAAAHSKRHRERMTRLNREGTVNQPEQRRGQSERMRKRWREDPEFRRLQLKGVYDFWEQYRKLRAVEARTATGAVEAMPGAWEGKGKEVPSELVSVHAPRIEETIDNWRTLTGALRGLDPLQRFIVAHTFGIEMQHNPRIVRQAVKLSKGGWQAELNAAYESLTKNRKLKKLLGE